MVVLVQLPEIMEKRVFQRIQNKFPQFISKANARITHDVIADTYRLMKNDEYYEDEVVKNEDEYCDPMSGLVIPKYYIQKRPTVDMVALEKSFGMVNIESFAEVAEGITFTLVEVYKA